jgi:hypothetical protein
MALSPLNFPNAPTVGQLYPIPPVTGQPTYIWDGTDWISQFALGQPYVPLNGSQPMSGLLTLSGDPTTALQAVTKQYADSILTALNTHQFSYGQLVKSGTNIALMPWNGNLLGIGGVNAVIPDAGVSLSPTGLTVSTLYYIYAVQTAGVVTALEASTTAYAISVTAGSNGQMVKTGDPTRRLVGMVRPIAGPAFSDLPAQRFVRSWLNRKRVQLRGATTGAFANGSVNVAVEINTAARVEFLLFADETADISNNGTVYNSVAGQSTYGGLSIDGAGLGAGAATLGGASGGASAIASADISVANRITASGLTEGYHYATMAGYVSGGIGTWYGGSAPQIYGTIG